MARYAVRFDRDAAVDLTSIRDHLDQARDREFADGFIDGVLVYCESLGALPHRRTRRDAILPGLRTLTWRRTITVAFTVNDDARQVVILGAFYRGRDYLSALARRLK